VDEKDILGLLEEVGAGRRSPLDALETLRTLPARRLGQVVHDSHRPLRRGVPEIVYAPGKDARQLADAVASALDSGENCLVSRVSPAQAEALLSRFADRSPSHREGARMVTFVQRPVEDAGRGEVLVLSAGTSDVPVAEEAAIACEVMGNRVGRGYDVGVAALHRLLEHLDAIRRATVIIAVAGMEGALPGVVAGLAPCPVIAVPTSVGYGASAGGFTALLGMLSSCAGGLTVVNIDNGIGAAIAATLVNRRRPGIDGTA
jgi:hypothetical protein